MRASIASEDRGHVEPRRCLRSTRLGVEVAAPDVEQRRGEPAARAAGRDEPGVLAHASEMAACTGEVAPTSLPALHRGSTALAIGPPSSTAAHALAGRPARAGRRSGSPRPARSPSVMRKMLTASFISSALGTGPQSTACRHIGREQRTHRATASALAGEHARPAAGLGRLPGAGHRRLDVPAAGRADVGPSPASSPVTWCPCARRCGPDQGGEAGRAAAERGVDRRLVGQHQQHHSRPLEDLARARRPPPPRPPPPARSGRPSGSRRPAGRRRGPGRPPSAAPSRRARGTRRAPRRSRISSPVRASVARWPCRARRRAGTVAVPCPVGVVSGSGRRAGPSSSRPARGAVEHRPQLPHDRV